jgi:hypothetical protein
MQFPFHLSFSYLRPAVETSLDTKKAHMEPNNAHIEFLKKKIVLLILLLLSNLKAKIGHIFFKCVLESHLTSISGLGGSILSKSLYANLP